MSALDALAAGFEAPPVASRPWAFWFLNDATPLAELTEQLDAFAAAGFGTVCPCARIGLAESIGYLTPAWWELMRGVVAHCATLGLRVVLYDEASYPSGAANGQVVAENPEYASRCLVRARAEASLDEGEVAYLRPNLGRELWSRRVATVVRGADGVRRLVDADEAGLIRVSAAEHGVGTVAAEAFFDAPSGGTIRGAHVWQDDESPLAPASADLMNPDAVAAFRRLTHDAYAEHVGAWFGSTIVALFTDEPAPLGRGPRPGALAWTPGLEADLAQASGLPLEEVLRDLGDAFVPAAALHALHEQVVAQRVATVYHGAQRAWCDAHGLALTGHPERPDEVAALEAFTWPGQDTVWRWVLPGETALHGEESAGPRTASSAAVLRRLADPTDVVPVVNEVYGAYGWRLTLDEMKWLADWLAVRGTSAFLLHALFASVRGNRAFESEPDLGLANAWWPHLPRFLTYLARMSLLGEALVESPAVAVAVLGDRVPVEEVAPLYERQIGFVYAGPDALATGAFGAVVCRPDDAEAVRAAAPRATVVVAGSDGWLDALASCGPQVLRGDRSTLRVRAGRLPGTDARLLTNEGEDPLVLDLHGTVWDAWTGELRTVDGPTELPRRGSLWLTGPVPGVALSAASGDGTARTDAMTQGGGVPLDPWATQPAAPAGDWTDDPAWETFAGAVTYVTGFELAEPTGLLLDLGAVGDNADVTLNGTEVAALLWAPYRCAIPATATRRGRNELRVRVTNSSANRWEGALRPSGLMGPVTLSVDALR